MIATQDPFLVLEIFGDVAVVLNAGGRESQVADD